MNYASGLFSLCGTRCDIYHWSLEHFAISLVPLPCPESPDNRGLEGAKVPLSSHVTSSWGMLGSTSIRAGE